MIKYNQPAYPRFLINGRFLTRPKTGVERVAYNYTKCLIKNLGHNELKIAIPKNVEILKTSYPDIPKSYLFKYGKIIKPKTIGGHVWEQIFLPIIQAKLKANYIINFTNTAPIFAKNNLVFIHDTAYKDVPNTFNKFFAVFYNILMPTISKRAYKIFTVSNFSKKRLMKLYNIPSCKIYVIHNGITPLQKKAKTFKFRVQLLNSKNKKYITYIGSLSSRKNIKNLIMGFYKAKQQAPLLFKNIRLLLIGKKDKNFKLNLPIKYTQNKNIIFAGYVADNKFQEYLDNTILGINLSIYEGFNLPPGEMLSSNIPILLSDIEVNKEIYKQATFVSPYNIQSISKALIDALANYNETIQRAKKLKTLVKNYTWDKSCKMFINKLK